VGANPTPTHLLASTGYTNMGIVQIAAGHFIGIKAFFYDCKYIYLILASVKLEHLIS
jgi:hypothetical protein